MNKVIINGVRPSNAMNSNIYVKQESLSKPFAQVLDTVIGNKEVRFSKHAIQRLEDRNIRLDNNDIKRIEGGISKAKQKGINETLIIMDNKAFVASVHNKTIITATLDEHLKDSVFTNIDGAVIV